MTAKQIGWYWREWAAVRRAMPAADRHEFHARALGQDKSSKLLTNKDFDLVLAEFWTVTHPDNVHSQMRQRDQTRVRAMHTVMSFPAIYVARVCMDKYGTRDPEHLTLEQLCQLAMTLNKRREGIEDRKIRAAQAQAEGRAEAGAETVAERPVLLCSAPGCAVAYFGPGPCPCCGRPGKRPAPSPPQPFLGLGGICLTCRHRRACPPRADLRRWRGGEETCFEWDPIPHPVNPVNPVKK